MPKYPIEAPLLGEGAARGLCQKVAVLRKRTATKQLPVILADFVCESGYSPDIGSWVVCAWAASRGMDGALRSSAPALPAPPPAAAAPPPPPVLPPPTTVPSPAPARPRRRHPIRGFLVLLIIGVALWGTLVVLQKPQSSRLPQPLRMPWLATPKSSAPPLPLAPPNSTPEPLSSVQITVSRAGITFNGTTLSHSKLNVALRRIAQENDKCPVEILFDRNVDPHVLEDIKTRCRESGLRKLYVTKCDIE